MTIEAGFVPNGVRTAVADTRSQKNKSAASDGQVVGFGAVLAAIDSLESAVQTVAAPVDTPVVGDLIAVSTASEVSTASAIAVLEPTVKDLVPTYPAAAHFVGAAMDAFGLAESDALTRVGNGTGSPSDQFSTDPDAMVGIDSNVSVNAGDGGALHPRRYDKKPDVHKLVETSDASETDSCNTLLTVVPIEVEVHPASMVPDLTDVSPQALQTAATPISQFVSWSSPMTPMSQTDIERSDTGVVKTSKIDAQVLRPVGKPEGVKAVFSLALDALAEMPVAPGKQQSDTAAKPTLAVEGLTVNALSKVQPESRSLPLVTKAVEQAIGQIAVPLAVSGTLVSPRREDQARERSVFRSNAIEGSALGQSFLSTSASVAVQYTPELQMSPDVYVAEKVAYWISNDVQNAEMKLDGIGLDPVEVSIRMHGNEAHVAFRTDELQARNALESAGAHLKELLQREGLVLTGVSVGTAGAGDSGGGDAKSRQGARQGSVSAVVPTSTRSESLTGRSTGARLDLFV